MRILGVVVGLILAVIVGYLMNILATTNNVIWNVFSKAGVKNIITVNFKSEIFLPVMSVVAGILILITIRILATSIREEEEYA